MNPLEHDFHGKASQYGNAVNGNTKAARDHFRRTSLVSIRTSFVDVKLRSALHIKPSTLDIEEYGTVK